jgi:hypothetical protein
MEISFRCIAIAIPPSKRPPQALADARQEIDVRTISQIKSAETWLEWCDILAVIVSRQFASG